MFEFVMNMNWCFVKNLFRLILKTQGFCEFSYNSGHNKNSGHVSNKNSSIC